MILAVVPGRSAAQTVERLFSPFGTGASTTIYPGETRMAATDLVDLLEWNVPGAAIRRLSDGEVKITLRRDVGIVTPPPNPLLIVDGYKVSAEDFSWRLLSLTPATVERVIVLRDLGSAAVFGIRAAGGVIMVYTRRR